MVEENADQSRQVTDYVQEKFYAEYLEGLKGKWSKIPKQNWPKFLPVEFVRIPSLSPLFDPNWQTNRELFRQMEHLVQFTRAQNVQGIKIKPLEEPGRSPFLIIEVEPMVGSSCQN